MLDYKPANKKALLADSVLSNPEMSPRELRMMLAKYNQRVWHRLMSDANEIRFSTSNRSLEVIREEITKFKH